MQFNHPIQPFQLIWMHLTMFGQYARLLFEICCAAGGGGSGQELSIFFGFGQTIGFTARALLFVLFVGGNRPYSEGEFEFEVW